MKNQTDVFISYRRDGGDMAAMYIYQALKDGMAILLRHELSEYYERFENSVTIPKTEWDDIEQTHAVYNSLGGNHTGDRLYEFLKQKHLGN